MTHLPALEGLIERLSNATGPDRALDLLLAQALVPDVVVLRRNDDDTGNEPHTYWEYTGSVDAALALAERVLPGVFGTLAFFPDSAEASVMVDTSKPTAGGNVMVSTRSGRATAPTAPLAIILATLRSLTKLEG